MRFIQGLERYLSKRVDLDRRRVVAGLYDDCAFPVGVSVDVESHARRPAKVSGNKFRVEFTGGQGH